VLQRLRRYRATTGPCTERRHGAHHTSPADGGVHACAGADPDDRRNSDLMALGRDLKPGDEGAVVRTDGTTAVVRVTQVEEHPETNFPTSAVYGDINHPGLRLVTCGGAFDQQAHSYIVW
jgi:hypothetical protein